MTSDEPQPPADQVPAPNPVVTMEEYERLKAEAQKAQEHLDQLLRLRAEFENTRKRMLRDQQEHERRTSERLLAEFLGVLDDFERAFAAAEQDTDPTHLRTGIEMIYRRMKDFLKGHGVEPIESLGQRFDPAQHEAVEHVSTGDQPEDTVIGELRKGYVRHGRVLRPASVKVATRRPEQTGGTEDHGTSNRD